MKTELCEINYIGRFVDSLDLSSSKEEDLANVLFESAECCENFYINFLHRNKNVVDDLLDYRESKLLNSNITLNNFIEMCGNTINHKVLERVFMQKLTSDDLTLLEDALLEGRISLTNLFNNFKENPNKNILKYVL